MRSNWIPTFNCTAPKAIQQRGRGVSHLRRLSAGPLGRLLMERREALLARAEKRPPRSLADWDFLLGVHDRCRMGALRFRRDAGSLFLMTIPAVGAASCLAAGTGGRLAGDRGAGRTGPGALQQVAERAAGSRQFARWGATKGQLHGC